MTDLANTRRRIIAAANDAAKFLLSPRATRAERIAEMDHAAGCVQWAVEPLIRAGRDDLAHRAAALVRDIEAARRG